MLVICRLLPPNFIRCAKPFLIKIFFFLYVKGKALETSTILIDARLKTNVKRITDALAKVEKINGVTFNWLNPTADQNRTEAGVIAQEIQEVLPEVVTTREDGMLAVRYERIIALLIESIKELKQEVEQLKRQ